MFIIFSQINVGIRLLNVAMWTYPIQHFTESYNLFKIRRKPITKQTSPKLPENDERDLKS